MLITLIFLLLSSATLSYLAIKFQPVLFIHLATPFCFALAVKYGIDLFIKKYSSWFDLTIDALCSAYLFYLFYSLLAGIERYLSGQPIIIAGNSTSYGRTMAIVLIGAAAGYAIYGLRVLYERWERRRVARGRRNSM